MKMTFPEAMTPIMYGMIALHDHILFFLSIMLFVVLYMFITTLQEFVYDSEELEFSWLPPLYDMSKFREEFVFDLYIRARTKSGKNYENYKNHTYSTIWSSLKSGVLMEMVWTIIPSLMLLLMAMPSFALLYAIDEIQASSIIVKVMGHQWYWSYEVTGISHVPFKMAFFDSYMLGDSDLHKGELRLLKTDNALILPKNTPVSMIVTSDDVLHSWAMPSCGVKIDAVPGSLSQISLLFKTSGMFNGQCSELCGVNHGFMPMELWVVDAKTFASLEVFLFEEYFLE